MRIHSQQFLRQRQKGGQRTGSGRIFCELYADIRNGTGSGHRAVHVIFQAGRSEFERAWDARGAGKCLSSICTSARRIFYGIGAQQGQKVFRAFSPYIENREREK